MKKKNTLLTITVAAAVLFAASAQAGGTGTSNPFKKNCQPAKPAKAPKPAKPPKPLIPTKFGGEAVAVDIRNTVTGATFVVADTGLLLKTGGSLSLTVGTTNLGVVSVGGAAVSVSGMAGVSSSAAIVTNFSLVVVNAGVTNVIAFSSASAVARAECGSNGVVLTASSQVVGLTIDGTNVVATGATNQVISLGAAGSIVLNAQLSSSTATRGEISVAALFLMLADFTGPIAFAEADIRCGSDVPPGMRACDKVTGGGFIVGTPSGAHGSFGVGGGIRRGAFWGHLNYIDHGTGMHVKATAVTGYTVIDPVTRAIDYNVTIDGVAGTARVLVADNGEPGRNDLFDITLSTGYHAGGDLGGAGSGGGNIQLHKCPPGWAR